MTSAMIGTCLEFIERLLRPSAASTLDGDQGPVLRRLSAEFELCAFGLSRVRREWEKHDPETLGGPMNPTLGA